MLCCSVRVAVRLTRGLRNDVLDLTTLLPMYPLNRTSQTSWFNTKPQQKHWVVEDFEDRVDSLLRSPIVADFHSPPGNPRPPLTRRRRDRENLQLIHYDPGQVYHLHYDKVDDSDKNGDPDRDGQRKARTRAAVASAAWRHKCFERARVGGRVALYLTWSEQIRTFQPKAS